MTVKAVNGGVATSFPQATWQLDATNYVSTTVTGMTPTITFPRPNTETSTDAYCRNCYTGMKWEIPIVVQGGSWPFKYELTNSVYTAGGGVSGTDYPSGMSIGETLIVNGDVQEVGSTYAVLVWNSPTGTSETIYILVTDQDGNTDTVELTLAIGTSKFVFVDDSAVSEGVGTFADPYKTFNTGMYGGSDSSSTNAGKIAVYRAGTYIVHNGSSGEAIIDATLKPRTHIAYPAESVTFTMSTARLQVNSCPDFFLGGIDCNGYKSTATNWRAFYINNNQNRLTFYKSTFNNMQKGTSGADNPACIVTWGLNDNVRRKYISVIRCEIKADCQIQLYGGFNSEYLVAEHNTCSSTTIASSNGGYFIQPKDEHANCTVRRNTALGISLLGTAIVDFINQGPNCNNQECCWNVFVATADATSISLIKWDSGSGDSSNKHDYRNTAICTTGRGYQFFADGVTDSTVELVGGVISGGSVDIFGTEGTAYNDNGNQFLTPTTDVDSNGKLVGTARTSYLGTYGFEVA